MIGKIEVKTKNKNVERLANAFNSSLPSNLASVAVPGHTKSPLA